MEFSPDQQNAIGAFRDWWRSGTPGQVFKLHGAAGTGKTTVAKTLTQEVGSAVFLAPTGKAASVLTKKGAPASTIHSAIYTLVADKEGRKGKRERTFEMKEDVRRARLFVVDEASMVNDEIAKDLESIGQPILALGDPYQLPPVKGFAPWIRAEPNVKLDMIHRQGEGSTILKLADAVRKGAKLKPIEKPDARVILHDDPRCMDLMLQADIVLVGTHKRRNALNTILRKQKGFPPGLAEGDKIVAETNVHAMGIQNGTIWFVEDTGEADGIGVIRDETGRVVELETAIQMERPPFWGPPYFDFAQALTVHRSQGSEWKRVVVVDDSGVFGADARRHLYTAVTRASEDLTVILPKSSM